MADGSDVGAVVFVIIIALLLFFTPLGGILVDLINGEYNPAPTEYWTANVTANPLNAGRVVPSGEKRVEVGESLAIEATAFEGWAFSQWTIDGLYYSSTPITDIPSQNPDEVLVVVANFESIGGTFEITPSWTVVEGFSQMGYTTAFRYLTFTNNGDATIQDISLKLNDPYGVFTVFSAVYDYGYYSLVQSRWRANDILNKYNRVCFVPSPLIPSQRSYFIASNSEKQLGIMVYAINPNLEA